MAIKKQYLNIWIATWLRRLVVFKGKIMNGIIISLLCLFVLLLNHDMNYATGIDESFKLCPLKVGQYVEYQIVGLFGKNQKDRYHISVIGKKIISKQEYFWIQIDISSATKREISFRALISPFDQVQFSSNPGLYISDGMLFLLKNAKKLFVSTDVNTSYYEVSPNIFLNTPDILKDSFYSETPYEKNKVDYSKMVIHDKNEPISVPAGNFECYHFEVKTHEWDAYTDEGIDLWRSDNVPFLGIVKMEFSKTKYRKKRHYRYYQLFNTDNLWGKLYAYFFVRRVFDMSRKDVFVIRLINYDAGDF